MTAEDWKWTAYIKSQAVSILGASGIWKHRKLQKKLNYHYLKQISTFRSFLLVYIYSDIVMYWIKIEIKWLFIIILYCHCHLWKKNSLIREKIEILLKKWKKLFIF